MGSSSSQVVGHASLLPWQRLRPPDLEVLGEAVGPLNHPLHAEQPPALVSAQADEGVGPRHLLVPGLAYDASEPLYPLPRFAREVNPDLDVGRRDVQVLLADAGADEDTGLLAEVEEG